MNINRSTVTKSLALAAGALALLSWNVKASAALLPLIEVMTEGGSGPTYLRPVGSPPHW